MGNTTAQPTKYQYDYSLLTTNILRNPRIPKNTHLLRQYLKSKYASRKFCHLDLINRASDGNLEILMAATHCQDIEEVVSIREHLWNPVLYAMANGHLEVIRFFVE